MTGQGFALRSGLRDVAHMPGRVFALAVHVGLLALLVGLSAGLVSRSLADIRAANDLARHEAVYFVSGEQDSTPSDGQLDRARKALATQLGRPGAYSLHYLGQERNLIYAYGDVAKAFGLTESKAPYALAGDQTGLAVGDVVDAGRVPVRVAATTSSGFLDLWMAYQPLGRRVLVVLPASAVEDLDTDRLAEVAARLVLPDGQGLADYIAAVEPLVPLLPRWVGDKVGVDFGPELRGRVAFLAVFAAGLLTTAVGVASGLGSLIRSRFHDYAVHHACGASAWHLALRCGVFVLSSWTLPSLIAGWVGVSLVAGGAHRSIVVIGLGCVIAVATAGFVIGGVAFFLGQDQQKSLREAAW